MSEFLSSQELHQLTGYARPSGQARWLSGQNIPHRHEDGRIIVSRVHVQSWLEGKTMRQFGGMNIAAIR